MQYQVIDADDIAALVELVNEAMEDGWKPQGGVASTLAVDQGRYSYYYAQAMVKESQ